jgi:acetyltransferase-like isoleucine patch superfamily enzyme
MPPSPPLRWLGQTSAASVRLWQRCVAKFFSFLLSGAFADFGRASVITPPFRFGGLGRVSVGRGVFIGAGSWIAALPQGEELPDEPLLQIGDHASIAGLAVILAARSVILEDQVLIARNVYIADHTHRFSDLSRPVLEQGISEPAGIRIRQGAWLGQNVVVCPGVTIGRNAVVGANSVVRQDVPDYCVAAGVPARVIRRIDQPRSS